MATQKNNTTLIINFLPLSLTDDEFLSIFSRIGPLNRSRCNISRDRQTKQSRGYGFVKYKNADHAATAIDRWNGSQLHDKVIKVAYARNGDNVKDAKLVIQGLLPTVTQKELQDMFIKFGTIIDACVITDHTTGQSKGFGFVLFDTRDEAEAAIAEMNGATPQGCVQPLLVRITDDKERIARRQATLVPWGMSAVPVLGCGAAREGRAAAGGLGADRYAAYDVGEAAATGDAVLAGGGYVYHEAACGQMPQNEDTNRDCHYVLFVYNIGSFADEHALLEIFSDYHSILKICVGRCIGPIGNGCEFVYMSSYAEARTAMHRLSGRKYFHKPLQVSIIG